MDARLCAEVEADADCVVAKVDTGDAVIGFVEADNVVELEIAKLTLEMTVEDETRVDEDDGVALALALVVSDDEATLFIEIGVEVLARLGLIEALVGTAVEEMTFLVLVARLALVVGADGTAL